MHWPLQSETPNLAHELMKTSNSKQPSHPILRACKFNHFEHVSHAQTHISERHHVQTNQSCAPIAEQRCEPRTWKCNYQRPDSQRNEEFCYRCESSDQRVEDEGSWVLRVVTEASLELQSLIVLWTETITRKMRSWMNCSSLASRSITLLCFLLKSNPRFAQR